jgi:hypothetical protein
LNKNVYNDLKEEYSSDGQLLHNDSDIRELIKHSDIEIEQIGYMYMENL